MISNFGLGHPNQLKLQNSPHARSTPLSSTSGSIPPIPHETIVHSAHTTKNLLSALLHHIHIIHFSHHTPPYFSTSSTASGGAGAT